MTLPVRVILSSSLFLLITCVPGFIAAQELTADEAQAIAREAYIYGFPIVDNYKAMFAFAIDADGKAYEAPFNTLKHRENVITRADAAVVTPTLDTSLAFLWMDLRAEPVVLGVPDIENERYYSIQLIDLYHYTFAYVGSRATGNKAGRYLVAGPNWEGDDPPNVSRTIRCETEFALAVYQTQLHGPEDLENVRNIQQKYTVQALSEFLDQPKPKAAAAVEFPPPKSTAEPDLAFLSTLNFALQFCPPHSSEVMLRKSMERIGVAMNREFNPADFSPEIQEAIRQGIKEGNAAIGAAQETLKVAEVIGSREFLGNDYLKRAVAAKIGRLVNAKEEALYPLYLSDAEGKPLDASEANYTLKFGVDEFPPVEGFWSITMYDQRNESIVENPLGRYLVSSYIVPSLTKDSDGGLTLYIQHEQPEIERSSNWLPAPKGPFYLVMRLYWPKQAAYDGSWTPPLVWRTTLAAAPSLPKPAGAEGGEEVQPSVLVDAPKPELERPSVWGEPTEVQIGIYVIDVDEINSADQSFAASIFFEAQWKNPFLRHKGPGPQHRALSDVWNPRMTIVGQQMQWRSYPESVEIQPDGSVTYRQKLWGRFSQPLRLQDFPFDRQELSIHIVTPGLHEDEIKIVPLMRNQNEISNLAETFSLPDFDVVSWKAAPRPYYPMAGDVGVAGFEMKLHVARQPTYYVLKVIVPLCLIVIMSWLPRWIDLEQTGTNIGVSTSAFLTLVAYLFAITVLLPRVSYVTRMDRFILLSTLTVFTGLLHTVANIVLIRCDKKQLSQQIDCWARAVYPALLAAVIVVAFLV